VQIVQTVFLLQSFDLASCKLNLTNSPGLVVCCPGL